MTTRRNTLVLVVLTVAAVVLGASAVAAFRAPEQAPGGTPPAVPTGPEVTGGPAEHTGDDYWTDERMREARPAPMPAPD